MVEAVPAGSIVYVRYKDHVLYRNQPSAVEDAAERETVGWLGVKFYPTNPTYDDGKRSKYH
jgi:hypothetical protein